MPGKKLPITRRIMRFIGNLLRPHGPGADLDAAYREMARDGIREAEALEWADATVGDVARGRP